MEIIRPDYEFSYWIFIWFVLYYIGFVKYSPKFTLILAIIHNIILFSLMIFYKKPFIKLLNFVIVVTLIKIIPLYLLRNEKITSLSIMSFIILFLIYLLYMFALHINNINKILDIGKNFLTNNDKPLLGDYILTNIYLYFK